MLHLSIELSSSGVGRCNCTLLFVFGTRSSILEIIYYDNKSISRKTVSRTSYTIWYPRGPDRLVISSFHKGD